MGAASVGVEAGSTADGIDFAVHPRSSIPIYTAVTTYSFYGQTAVEPGT